MSCSTVKRLNPGRTTVCRCATAAAAAAENSTNKPLRGKLRVFNRVLPQGPLNANGVPLICSRAAGTLLPADGFSAILLVQPFLERREVIADRGRIHLALTAQGLERVRPR